MCQGSCWAPGQLSSRVGWAPSLAGRWTYLTVLEEVNYSRVSHWHSLVLLPLLWYKWAALGDLGGGHFQSIHSVINTFFNSYNVSSTFLSPRAEWSNMVTTSDMRLQCAEIYLNGIVLLSIKYTLDFKKFVWEKGNVKYVLNIIFYPLYFEEITFGYFCSN